MKLRLLVICAALTLQTASASVIGTLGLGTSGVLTATLFSLTWSADTAGVPGGLPYNAFVNGSTSLTFFGCNGVLGSPGCLTQLESVSINNGTPFVAGDPLSPTFVTFSNDGSLSGAPHADLVYSLTTVFPGSTNTDCANLAVNDECSIEVEGPGGFISPVTLERTNGGTNASLSLGGLVYENGVLSSTWIGQFTATLSGPQATHGPLAIRNALCGVGDPCTIADQGNSKNFANVTGDFFATAVPEPGSMALIGIGILACGYLGRKGTKRKNA